MVAPGDGENPFLDFALDLGWAQEGICGRWTGVV